MDRCKRDHGVAYVFGPHYHASEEDDYPRFDLVTATEQSDDLEGHYLIYLYITPVGPAEPDGTWDFPTIKDAEAYIEVFSRIWKK